MLKGWKGLWVRLYSGAGSMALIDFVDWLGFM